MNFGLLLLATALYFNSYTAVDAQSNRNDVTLPPNQVRQRQRLTINNLIKDVWYLILEHFDFVEMTNLLKACPSGDLSDVATQIIRNRYKVILKYKLHETPDFFHKEIFKELTVYNLAVLNYFGNEIKNLEVHYSYMQTPDAIFISQYINLHWSKSLTKLSLDSFNEYTFQQFTNEFTNVEELQMSIRSMNSYGINKWTTNPAPLNQLFPNIRHLKLVINDPGMDYSFIDCDFEHLKNLTMGVYGHTSPEEEGQIARFLLKNQQIQTAYFERMPRTIAAHIQELLPNISFLSWTVYPSG